MKIRIQITAWQWRNGIRFLTLLVGSALLGYAAWSTAEQLLHQRTVSREFEDQRAEARALASPASAATTPMPVTAAAPPFPAQLTIARLGLNVMVEEGIGVGTLRKAAGHIPGTASPGHTGNVGVAAHRDTLFRGLKDIHKQDVIQLSTIERDFLYQVTGTSIVRPSDISVLNAVPGQKTLTLVTCYPFNFIGSAPYRFIVHANQVADPKIK